MGLFCVLRTWSVRLGPDPSHLRCTWHLLSAPLRCSPVRRSLARCAARTTERARARTGGADAIRVFPHSQ
jgi:hypothetical protein